MAYRGTFSRRNLKVNEKIKDGPQHGNVAHNHDNGGKKVQILTINGIEYFVRLADGPQTEDIRLNQFNNKTVDVEGVFVGNMIIISSITKVGN